MHLILQLLSRVGGGVESVLFGDLWSHFAAVVCLCEDDNWPCLYSQTQAWLSVYTMYTCNT
jgi:hypothetical protein